MRPLYHEFLVFHVSFELSIEQYQTVHSQGKHDITARCLDITVRMLLFLPPGPTEMALDKFRSSANRLNIPEIVSEPVLYVFKNATCWFSLQYGTSDSNSFEIVLCELCNTGYEILVVDIERSGLELYYGSTGSKVYRLQT